MKTPYNEISGPIQMYFINKEDFINTIVSNIMETIQEKYPNGFAIDGRLEYESYGEVALPVLIEKALENFIELKYKDL